MRTFSAIAISLFIILFPACEQTNEEAFNPDDLLALIDADEAFSLDGFNDEGAVVDDYITGLEIGGMSKTMVDTLWPHSSYRLRFGRQITNHDRTVTFDVNGDTAIGYITHTLEGNFIVVAIDTNTHAVVDSFVKTFSTDFNRKLRFVRIPDSNNPDGYHWIIDAFTLGTGGAGTKVRITKLDFIWTPDGGSDSVLYSFEASTVEDLFIPRQELPTFFAWTPMRVELTVENDDPVFYLDSLDSGERALFHFGRDRHHKARRRMNDSGYGADNLAGDNVFTVAWRAHGPGIGHRQRIFRMFFDVIDNATLFISDGGYNTAVWYFPYKIIRH